MVMVNESGTALLSGGPELVPLLAFLLVSNVFSLIFGAILNRHLLRFPRMFLRLFKKIPRWIKFRWSGARKAAVTGWHQHPADLLDMTAIQRALHTIDEAVEGDGGADAGNTLYDFAEENRLLSGEKKAGYKVFHVPAAYDGLPTSLTDEVTENYSGLARGFLSKPVQQKTTANNLYDDEEGAAIATLFRKSDRRCFYAIDIFRRTIGDNARRLIWRQTIVAAVPIIIGFFLLAMMALPSDGVFGTLKNLGSGPINLVS